MKEQRVMKSYEELKYSDDFMFRKVMGDKRLCREVIECLLQKPVGEITEIQTQKEYQFTADGKPIILDVYNKDSEGVVYDAEMQNLNHKSIEFYDFPRRSRFYQSSIDMDYMEKGSSYKKLPESNVMFICTFDPFEKGFSRYTFSEICKEDNTIHLADGTTKVFYNCCYEGDDIPEDLKSFYRYVETGEADDDLTRNIDDAVKRGIRNGIWRSQYMREKAFYQNAVDEGVEIGVEKGVEIGREERDAQKIEEMLRRGKTVEEIVDFCQYPYEQVKEIADSLLTLN